MCADTSFVTPFAEAVIPSLAVYTDKFPGALLCFPVSNNKTIRGKASVFAPVVAPSVGCVYTYIEAEEKLRNEK